MSVSERFLQTGMAGFVNREFRLRNCSSWDRHGEHDFPESAREEDVWTDLCALGANLVYIASSRLDRMTHRVSVEIIQEKNPRESQEAGLSP